MEVFGDLVLRSSILNNRYEKLVQSIYAEMNNPDVNRTAFAAILQERTILVENVQKELHADIQRFELNLHRAKKYSKTLQMLVSSFLEIMSSYHLSVDTQPSFHAWTLSSIKDSKAAGDILRLSATLSVIYNFLKDSNQNEVECKSKMKKLLETIPLLDSAKEDFINAIGCFVILKLSDISKNLEECEQRKLQYATKIGQLKTEVQRYEEVCEAISNVSIVREAYEVSRNRILDLEEKIMVLEFKLTKQSRLDTQGLQDELSHLRNDELQLTRSSKEFVTAKKDMFKCSAILPELHFWYHDLNPLNDLAATKNYPSRDFDTDFVVEKELSSCVILVKQTEGTLSIVKKFNLNQERTLLRHAIEILGRLRDHPNILQLNSIVHGRNDLIYLEHPYYPLGDLFLREKG